MRVAISFAFLLFAKAAWAGLCLGPSFDDTASVTIPVAAFEPTDSAYAGGAGGVTAGSLRWFPAPNPDPDPHCDPYVLEIDAAAGDASRTLPFVAEIEDAHSTAWRVPSDVDAGDHVSVLVTCRRTSSSFTAFADVFTVVAGPPAEGRAPVLGALATETVTAEGCGVTEAAALMSADVSAANPALVLLDAWIVPRGVPRSNEEQPRAADKLPVSLVDGKLLFLASATGDLTLFVRLTDPASAVASSIEQIDFVGPTPPPPPESGNVGAGAAVGCGATRGDATWIPAALAVAAALPALRRRRQQQRCEGPR